MSNSLPTHRQVPFSVTVAQTKILYWEEVRKNKNLKMFLLTVNSTQKKTGMSGNGHTVEAKLFTDYCSSH